MSGFGKRTCLVCGKEFEAQYAAALCCSIECKRKRKKMQQKGYDAHKKTIRDFIRELEARVTALEQAIGCKVSKAVSDPETEERNNELDDVETNHDPYGETEETLEPKALQECERMRLRAMTLPCGKRAECFNPDYCDKVPKGARFIGYDDPMNDHAVPQTYQRRISRNMSRKMRETNA